jgi:hypothetical protein
MPDKSAKAIVVDRFLTAACVSVPVTPESKRASKVNVTSDVRDPYTKNLPAAPPLAWKVIA